MKKKIEYDKFCESTYVPIFSKPWWLDATCGVDNWDVWIYKSDNNILAAMPYYLEKRNNYNYITKAKLTQNNGIIFKYNKNSKLVTNSEFEEKVINSATVFLDSLNLDVYEQQYHYSFKNWQPFYWNNFSCQLRYTYVIHNTESLEKVKKEFSPKLRSIIKKGEKNSSIITNVSDDVFYHEHEKVFLKQGLKCPFDLNFWKNLLNACRNNNCCQIMCAVDYEDNINSVAFYVWDEKSVYLLLGGSIPEFSNNDTYSYLIYEGIKLASFMRLKFDFEGSMIKRIAKASRQFGGEPMPYFRIRKIYNEEIIRLEAESLIKSLNR